MVSINICCFAQPAQLFCSKTMRWFTIWCAEAQGCCQLKILLSYLQINLVLFLNFWVNLSHPSQNLGIDSDSSSVVVIWIWYLNHHYHQLNKLNFILNLKIQLSIKIIKIFEVAIKQQQQKDEFNKIIFSEAHLHNPPFKCSSVDFMTVFIEYRGSLHSSFYLWFHYVCKCWSRRTLRFTTYLI